MKIKIIFEENDKKKYKKSINYDISHKEWKVDGPLELTFEKNGKPIKDYMLTELSYDNMVRVTDKGNVIEGVLLFNYNL